MSDILTLARTLGAKNLINNDFAANPILQKYLMENGRAKTAEEQLQATTTPLGALSSGIALYMQRKRENRALEELTKQMEIEKTAKEQKRLGLVNSLPEQERATADFLDYDTLVKTQAEKLKGLTPEEKLDLENRRLQNIKLQKEINQVGKPNQDKAPAGYRFTDNGDLEAIAGGPASKQSAESAGKIALIKQGLKDIEGLEQSLTDEDGSYNRTKIAGLRTYGRPAARDEYSRLFNSLNARLRLESGAAVPEAEVKRAFETFAPSPLDSDNTIKSKLSRLKDYFISAQEEIGQGRGAKPINITNEQNKNVFQSSSGVKFTIKR